MAASFASTSRVNAARLPQICGIAESFLEIASSSRRPLQPPLRPVGSSAKAEGKRSQIGTIRRCFSTARPRNSTWAAGTDVGATSSSSTPSPSSSSSSSTSTGGANGKRTSLPPAERSVTVGGLLEAKTRGEPIAVLTAYDYASGLSMRSASIDVCLVGDSLANVALGYRSTQQISLEAMIHHTKAVARGLRHPILNQEGVAPVPLLIVDLPYGYSQGSPERAVEAATALVQKGGANGVKIEGGLEIIPLIERLTSFGMPVMAHIGLQPQRASSSSAFQLQGRTADQAMDLLHAAVLLEGAGAFSTVLECIPSRVGAEISKRLERMFTIGIGAGKGCDGQVLVADDMLGECTSPLHILAGITTRPASQEQGQGQGQGQSFPQPSELWPSPPRFARSFARQITGGSTLGAMRIAAVQAYVEAIKSRNFPNDDEGYKMKKEEWAALKQKLDDYDRQVQQEFEAAGQRQFQQEFDTAAPAPTSHLTRSKRI